MDELCNHTVWLMTQKKFWMSFPGFANKGKDKVESSNDQLDNVVFDHLK